MKKIGFIDYFLDEWHANNYPAFFETAVGDEMKVAYAYGKIDSPNGMTNQEWSLKYNIPLCGSIEELIEKSDYIIVLSPDNPEMHVELTDLALKSQKPVYVDKTFAPSIADAKKIFANADAHNTPCYSSSALNFSNELKTVKKEGIMRINSVGGGMFEIYTIHQVEQIVNLMGFDAKRVMYLGENPHPALLIEFSNNRIAQINFFPDQPFHMTIGYEDLATSHIQIDSDFFGNCIKEMAQFFKTARVPVPHEQTIAVIGIIEAANKAKDVPYEWVEVSL